MHTFSLQAQDDSTKLVITNVNSHQVIQLSFNREELNILRAVIDSHLTRISEDYFYTFTTDDIIDQIHEEFYCIEDDINPNVTDQHYNALHDFMTLDDAEQRDVVNNIINNKPMPLRVNDKTEEYENALMDHVITSLINNHE